MEYEGEVEKEKLSDLVFLVPFPSAWASTAIPNPRGCKEIELPVSRDVITYGLRACELITDWNRKLVQITTSGDTISLSSSTYHPWGRNSVGKDALERARQI